MAVKVTFLGRRYHTKRNAANQSSDLDTRPLRPWLYMPLVGGTPTQCGLIDLARFPFLNGVCYGTFMYIRRSTTHRNEAGLSENIFLTEWLISWMGVHVAPVSDTALLPLYIEKVTFNSIATKRWSEVFTRMQLWFLHESVPVFFSGSCIIFVKCCPGAEILFQSHFLTKKGWRGVIVIQSCDSRASENVLHTMGRRFL